MAAEASKMAKSQFVASKWNKRLAHRQDIDQVQGQVRCLCRRQTKDLRQQAGEANGRRLVLMSKATSKAEIVHSHLLQIAKRPQPLLRLKVTRHLKTCVSIFQ